MAACLVSLHLRGYRGKRPAFQNFTYRFEPRSPAYDRQFQAGGLVW